MYEIHTLRLSAVQSPTIQQARVSVWVLLAWEGSDRSVLLAVVIIGLLLVGTMQLG